MLKWPNDIIIAGKKVGGILIETSTKPGKIDYVVLGIGLNVNTPRSLFPEAISETATSLAEESGQNIAPLELLQCLFGEFEALYVEFLAGGFDKIRKQWKAMSNTIGSRVKIDNGRAEIAGEAMDIDSAGSLLLSKGNGGVEPVISGDVNLATIANL
jgi:BirA family biotin operon repressor/biotin-[acetyl-CoA-carboxylase] ligase